MKPTSAKTGLEDLLEARLKATGNWPQPPWVIEAMAQDFRSDLESRIAAKIDGSYVQKIYRRKIKPDGPGSAEPR